MPEPELLPKLFHHEVVEFEPVTRAAGEATDAAAAEPADDGGIDVVLSTETPCDEWGGLTVLSHERSAVDLSIARKGLSLYLEHGGYPQRMQPDMDLHIGIIENVRLGDDKKLRGRVYFSSHERAARARADFTAKPPTLRFMSIRYLPIKRKLNRDETGLVTSTVMTRWRPEEGSIVGIPADPNAGRARSAGADLYPVETEGEPVTRSTATQEAPPMPEPITEPAAQATPAAASAEPAAAVSVTRSAGGPAAASADQILNLCDAHNVPITRARQFIAQGLSLEAAKGAVLDDSQTRGVTAQPGSEVDISGVPAKDRKRFSIARAIARAVAVKEGNGQYDGLEGQVSQEIARQTPSNYRGVGGHFIPMSLLTPEERWDRAMRRGTRAMGTGVSGGGAELVFDQAGDLIELLTAQMLCAQFGAQTLMGLTGPVQFPVETGEPTAYFMGENPAAEAASSQLSFTTRVLGPKEAIAVVPYPRRLLTMAAIDVEARARMRLISKHARLWDGMALHGRGTNGEPTGIYNTPGVGAVAFGGVPAYGKLVDLGGAIADANADSAAMRYMTTPLMAAKLKQTLVASAAGASFIWNGTFRNGEVAGYGAGATKQVSQTLGAGANEHGILFGDWTALTFGHWGALEFIVDTITLAGKGQIKITTNELGDVMLERPEAFAVATGATIA